MLLGFVLLEFVGFGACRVCMLCLNAVICVCVCGREALWNSGLIGILVIGLFMGVESGDWWYVEGFVRHWGLFLELFGFE